MSRKTTVEHLTDKQKDKLVWLLDNGYEASLVGERYGLTNSAAINAAKDWRKRKGIGKGKSCEKS